MFYPNWFQAGSALGFAQATSQKATVSLDLSSWHHEELQAREWASGGYVPKNGHRVTQKWCTKKHETTGAQTQHLQIIETW